MEIFFTILIMTLVVSLSGVVTRVMPFQIPLPLMQIAIGALLAWPTFGLHVEFDPELFLVLFIPPLLFADGWKTPTREFLEHGREIFGLALALVVVTVVGIGFLIYWVVPGIPLIPAFALAAVLSPTDAVALSGIVGEGRIPKKIMGILQGEALMNDASGLVSLKFAVAVAMGTMIFTVGGATVEFMKVAIGGILAGFVVSWLYGRSLRFLSRWGGDEPATQIVLLFLLPFASYLIAEHIGVSGILAAVAAGMTITRSGVMRRAPLAMRLRANSTWAMLEFVFNGMVFLLFIVDRARTLRMSSYVLSSVYLGGSGLFLVIGLSIGGVLGALSADYGLSLLTLLAFAAIYPLAIVLVVALRRAHPQDASSAAAGEGGEGAPSADAVPTVDDALGAGVDAVAARFELTPREREILGYLARGRTAKFIAEELVISENTAWAHIKRVYAKTGVHSKQELMSVVEQQGRSR